MISSQSATVMSQAFTDILASAVTPPASSDDDSPPDRDRTEADRGDGDQGEVSFTPRLTRVQLVLTRRTYLPACSGVMCSAPVVTM